MTTDGRYTIDELTALTGFSRRTIRFYVEKGLVEPPAGRGKGGFYGESQLLALRRIDAARKDGRSLASIAKDAAGPVLPVGEAAAPYGLAGRSAAAAPERMLRWELAPGLYLEASDEAMADHGELLAALLDAAGHERTIGTKRALSPAKTGRHHARTDDE